MRDAWHGIERVLPGDADREAAGNGPLMRLAPASANCATTRRRLTLARWCMRAVFSWSYRARSDGAARPSASARRVARSGPVISGACKAKPGIP